MRTKFYILVLAAMICRLSVFGQANMSSGFTGGGGGGGGGTTTTNLQGSVGVGVATSGVTNTLSLNLSNTNVIYAFGNGGNFNNHQFYWNSSTFTWTNANNLYITTNGIARDSISVYFTNTIASPVGNSWVVVVSSQGTTLQTTYAGIPTDIAKSSDIANVAKVNANNSFTGTNSFANTTSLNTTLNGSLGIQTTNGAVILSFNPTNGTMLFTFATGLTVAVDTNGTVTSNTTNYNNGVNTITNAANTFGGNGALITALNASQLTSGTVPLAQLPSNYTNGVNVVTNDTRPLNLSGADTFTNVGNKFAGGVPAGSSLTNVVQLPIYTVIPGGNYSGISNTYSDFAAATNVPAGSTIEVYGNWSYTNLQIIFPTVTMVGHAGSSANDTNYANGDNSAVFIFGNNSHITNMVLNGYTTNTQPALTLCGIGVTDTNQTVFTTPGITNYFYGCTLSGSTCFGFRSASNSCDIIANYCTLNGGTATINEAINTNNNFNIANCYVTATNPPNNIVKATKCFVYTSQAAGSQTNVGHGVFLNDYFLSSDVLNVSNFPSYCAYNNLGLGISNAVVFINCQFDSTASTNISAGSGNFFDAGTAFPFMNCLDVGSGATFYSQSSSSVIVNSTRYGGYNAQSTNIAIPYGPNGQINNTFLNGNTQWTNPTLFAVGPITTLSNSLAATALTLTSASANSFTNTFGRDEEYSWSGGVTTSITKNGSPYAASGWAHLQTNEFITFNFSSTNSWIGYHSPF